MPFGNVGAIVRLFGAAEVREVLTTMTLEVSVRERAAFRVVFSVDKVLHLLQ